MSENNFTTKIARIVATLEEQAKKALAAAAIANGDDYCDFFVENGGDGKPWHEKCPEDLIGVKVHAERFSAKRLTRIDELKLRENPKDDYCDFFVENDGDGKPWHEKCPEVSGVENLLGNPTRRAILLSRTQVVRTLQRVRGY